MAALKTAALAAVIEHRGPNDLCSAIQMPNESGRLRRADRGARTDPVLKAPGPRGPFAEHESEVPLAARHLMSFEAIEFNGTSWLLP